MILALKKHWMNKRAFGHFIALGMGVSAALVLFGTVWPAAKSMMGTTVTSMESLTAQVDGSLNGMKVSASGTTITLTFPSNATPASTSSDYTVTDNGNSDAVSSVAVSGQTATVMVGTVMSSGSAVDVTYTSGTNTFSGAGTAA